MSTDNNTIATPATDSQTAELITSFSEPAPTGETLAQKVERLEAQIAQARIGNLKRPIENPDGSTRSYTDLRSEHQKFLDDMALAVESSRRQREEMERRNPVSYASPNGQIEWRPQSYTEKPLMDQDAAVREFGLAKWSALTPKQRAQAVLVTKRDVDAVKLDEVFGRTSSGKKAMELSSENPALYRMAKRKAKDEGLI